MAEASIVASSAVPNALTDTDTKNHPQVIDNQLNLSSYESSEETSHQPESDYIHEANSNSSIGSAESETNRVHLTPICVVLPAEIPYIYDFRESLVSVLFGDEVGRRVWHLYRRKSFLLLLLVFYGSVGPLAFLDFKFRIGLSFAMIPTLILQVFSWALLNVNVLFRIIRQFEVRFAFFNIVLASLMLGLMFKDVYLKIVAVNTGLFSGNALLIDAWPTPLRRKSTLVFSPFYMVYTHALLVGVMTGFVDQNFITTKIWGYEVDLVARFVGFYSYAIVLMYKSLWITRFHHKDRLYTYRFPMQSASTTRQGLKNLAGIFHLLQRRDSLSRKFNASRTRRFSEVAKAHGDLLPNSSVHEDLMSGQRALLAVAKMSVRNLFIESQSSRKKKVRIFVPEFIPFEFPQNNSVGNYLFGQRYTAVCLRICSSNLGKIVSLISYFAGAVMYLLCLNSKYASLGYIAILLLVPVIVIWISTIQIQIAKRLLHTWSFLFQCFLYLYGSFFLALIIDQTPQRLFIMFFAVVQCCVNLIDALPVGIIVGKKRIFFILPALTGTVFVTFGVAIQRFLTVQDASIRIIKLEMTFSSMVIGVTFVSMCYTYRSALKILFNENIFIHLSAYARALKVTSEAAEGVRLVFRDTISKL